jgi:hypothetical protein
MQDALGESSLTKGTGGTASGTVQGYLAHKKPQTLKTLQLAYLGPHGVPRAWAFSYERGTPVSLSPQEWRGIGPRQDREVCLREKARDRPASNPNRNRPAPRSST